MKGTVKELLEELKAEQTAQDNAIRETIQKELTKTPITFENLDNNLIEQFSNSLDDLKRGRFKKLK